MAPTELHADPARRSRVLVVDDEADLLDLIGDIVTRERDCRILMARNLAEARDIMSSQAIDLLVTDVHLPDGDGTTLLPILHKKYPNAGAIVITGAPSLDKAITAIRSGADDFLLKPFTADDLKLRVRKALKQHHELVRTDKRLLRLRTAVRKLNEARKQVTKKVDLLCNDLIGAYGDLSKQFEVVRTQEGFRNYITQSADLEQMLCHTMDYLMRQMGYSNIAIWLAGDDSSFQLGAYMKYTIPGDEGLTRAMRHGLVSLVMHDGLIHLKDDELREQLSPAELQYLADQDVIAVNCTYLGEPLAAIVMFRESTKSFSEDDLNCLKMISPMFAVSLASMVRGTDGDSGGDEDFDPMMDDGEDRDGGDGPDKDKKKKPDPADWWKRGDTPPF